MKKLSDYIVNIIIGICLIIIAIVLLAWNESRIARNLATSRDAESVAVSVSSDKVEKANEEHLIYTSGTLMVNDTVEDVDFNVSVVSSKLSRVVEMYQWQYTNGEYRKIWSENLVDSSKFKDQSKVNPTSKNYNNKTYIANIVKVGAFSLSNIQKKDLSANKNLTTLSTSQAEKIGYKINDIYYINSIDPTKPEIGDIRVSFYYNDTKKISVLAMQTNNTFSNYISSSGKTINIVNEQSDSLKKIISNIDETNDLLDWIIRASGLVISIIGFIVVLIPFGKLKIVFPIIKVSINNIVSVIAISIGSSVASFTISISWLLYRPLVGILLIILSLALTFVVYRLLYQKKMEEKAKEPLLTDGVKALEEVGNKIEKLDLESEKASLDITNNIDSDIEVLDFKSRN